MCPEYYRRGRNWFTAMGVLFIISALIVLLRQIIIWTPDFALDFLLNSEITNEKVSIAMIAFGGILVALGFRKKHDQAR
jgi:hypothetical protein